MLDKREFTGCETNLQIGGTVEICDERMRMRCLAGTNCSRSRRWYKSACLVEEFLRGLENHRTAVMYSAMRPYLRNADCSSYYTYRRLLVDDCFPMQMILSRTGYNSSA